MKPNRFSSLNHFTVPVDIRPPRCSVLECRGTAWCSTRSAAGTAWCSTRSATASIDCLRLPTGAVIKVTPWSHAVGAPARESGTPRPGDRPHDQKQDHRAADRDQPGAEVEEVAQVADVERA